MNDYAGILREFSTLGPALGSVIVIGIICWALLKLIKELSEKLFFMFSEHSQALSEIRRDMEAHTIIVKTVAENVSANTKATQESSKSSKEMVKLIKKLQLSHNK